MRDRHGVGHWKTIRKEWDILSSKISFSVENGQRVRFWNNKWCEDELFCVSFPSLFVVAISKEAWMTDVCNSEGKGGWSFKQKGCKGMRKIRWFGWFQGARTFWLNLSILFWSPVTLFIIPMEYNLEILCATKGDFFLHGRRHKGKP